MKQFEYLTVDIDEDGLVLLKNGWEHLDKLGEQGWELVAIHHERGSEASATLKREASQ